MTFLSLLAEAATTGGSVSEDFVIKLVPAVITTVIAGLVGHKLGASKKVQIQPPIPKITVDHEVELVSKDELRLELMKIEKAFDDLREDLDKERGIARTANGNLHKRIDTMSERMGQVIGELGSMSQNVSRLLELALNRRTRSGS